MKAVEDRLISPFKTDSKYEFTFSKNLGNCRIDKLTDKLQHVLLQLIILGHLNENFAAYQYNQFLLVDKDSPLCHM